MEINSLTRLKIELDSFKLLVTANLVGAALTLAFSISYGVTNLIPFISGEPIEPRQLPFILILISGFATAISWITRSAELMEEHDEITKGLEEIIKRYKNKPSEDGLDSSYDDEVIGIIVRCLAFYRKNTDKINELKWGGRLTGVFLLATGIPQFISFIDGSYPVNSYYVLAQGFALVSSLVVSLAAWYVPVIIKRFTETWDARLSLADDANEKLKRILEGTE
ncbi:hypothetical protein HN807_06970 [Candidatus Bathyarchaeota archaeon]|jgi:hypothetical protein|nr:hypothetical protein [Candidatus Bathyarchaeota archaeon]MBT4424200.1 hypothetical protein [Candidatus Bathyarchaeota archaeon]MBT6603738.1 hypothetical protein [Candidatus Bathyarchaeota archaeon]MBT7187588.1 hypothetical protein [Candidatus Bathyarchaeota archaeon]MBT7346808.1 hypothetical protein [Candidatus Bathyarchaeota archaeon]